MKIMAQRKRQTIISDVKISKKIEDMHNALVGFWKSDDWDVRKCPEPSAIEYAKTPSIRNRWIRFGQIKNVWLKTELKYFYYKNIVNGRWRAVTVWKRKGTAINHLIKDRKSTRMNTNHVAISY